MTTSADATYDMSSASDFPDWMFRGLGVRYGPTVSLSCKLRSLLTISRVWAAKPISSFKLFAGIEELSLLAFGSHHCTRHCRRST
eukprot:4836730-Pleurochrysis_carterae.AAC.1